MLFNCINCGKTISSKASNACPYCSVGITDFVAQISQGREKGFLKEKYRGSIFALTLKEHKL